MLKLGAPDPAAVSAASEQVAKYLGVLDKSLAGKRYLVGDALTPADLTIAASLTYANALELPLAEYPQVAAWFDRMQALDAWQKTQP